MPQGPADAIDLGALRRALVIKRRHHGDTLLAAPVFGALKAAAPALEIDALVYDDTAPMLAGQRLGQALAQGLPMRGAEAVVLVAVGHHTQPGAPPETLRLGRGEVPVRREAVEVEAGRRLPGEHGHRRRRVVAAQGREQGQAVRGAIVAWRGEAGVPGVARHAGPGAGGGLGRLEALLGDGD